MNYSESNKNALKTCLCRDKAPKVRVTEFFFSLQHLILFFCFFFKFLTLPVLFQQFTLNYHVLTYSIYIAGTSTCCCVSLMFQCLLKDVRQMFSFLYHTKAIKTSHSSTHPQIPTCTFLNYFWMKLFTLLTHSSCPQTRCLSGRIDVECVFMSVRVSSAHQKRAAEAFVWVNY